MRLTRIWAILGALGSGLLVGGTALAVYSRFFASTWPLDEIWIRGERWFRSEPGWNASAVPGYFATASVCVGIAMLIALVILIVRIDRNWDSYGDLTVYVVSAVSATLLVLSIMAIKYPVTESYHRLQREAPLFAQLPTALAAAALVVAGTILVIGILLRPDRIRSLSRRAVAISAVAGLLVSVTVGVVAVRAGDDRRNVDHVTASRVEAPTAPDRLGSERYRVPISLACGSNSRCSTDLVAAGAGFVMASTAGLTAYDGTTGAQRWHYLRKNTEPDQQDGVSYVGDSLQSLDGGNIVLAKWNQLGWIAFDASTGEILWQNSDFIRDLQDPELKWNVEGNGYRSAPGLLTLASHDRVLGYDPRTGSRKWSADTSGPECRGSRNNFVVTATAIYRTLECRNQTESWLTAIALDLQTGVVVGSRELERTSDMTHELYSHIRRYSNTVAIEWSYRNRIVVGTPEKLTTAVTISDREHIPLAADPDGPDVVVQDSVRDPKPAWHFSVLDSDNGAVKYALPGMRGDNGSRIFLTSEIVEAAFYFPDDGSYRREIRAWSRTDGSPTLTHPLQRDDAKCSSPGALVAPGAVLVVCGEEQSAELIGFGISR
ncbi:PQQ-binding-like beta-propeller repeat protein [Nocardia sp. NPDC051030]|uniref:outer membrane protein assembly factor BamB family protein n=1 Tax=Nocardia sp. NPDC051030 TaxID=3155162 RepID=UPI0034375A03